MATRRISPERLAALNGVDDCLTRVRRAQTNKRIVREYAERAQVFLPPLSLSILAELHRHGPRRVKAFAQRLAVDLPQFSREIKSLVDSGHVELAIDAADGRARIVQLTPHGAAAWSRYRAAARAALVEVVSDWSDDDLATFAALFTRFLAGRADGGGTSR